MFGRQRRNAEALEELREEFSAADRHARAALADAMAQIELRMARERDDRETVRLSTETAIENTQSSLNAQAKDVGLLLAQVAETCAKVAERVEADRLERRAFVEALQRLAQSSGVSLESGERPLGGVVFPASELAQHTEPVASAPAAEYVDPPKEPQAADPSPDQTIDLPAHEEAERTSRILPRWATKRS